MVRRIALAARRLASPVSSDSEDDPETLQRIRVAVRGLAKMH